MELLGQRHGEARQQRLAVHVGVGIQLEAASAPDGVGRFVGGDHLVRGGEQRQLVIQAHQAAAGVDGIRRRRPVLEFLVYVRHHVGHLRLGVLRGPHMVGGDHRLGDVGVEHLHAQGEQKRRAVLQGRLHQVADKGAHLPQREAFRETLDREEARLQHVGAGFLPQGEAAGVRVLDGVEVDDLVAQFAAVVVVQVRRIGLGDAVGVGEEGAPVDQVCGIANAVGERGRAQGGRHGIAQHHQLVALIEILGVAGKSDGEHQPEIPDRVVEAGGERLLRALQQVADALAGEFPEQVPVAGRPAPLLGLLRLIVVLDAQVGVVAQLGAHLGRAKQVELNAGAGRAVGIERDQDFRHALVGARLRHEFEHDAHAVAVDEDLFGGEIGGVGQPVGELLGGRLHGTAEGEALRLPVVAMGADRRSAVGGVHGDLTAHGWHWARQTGVVAARSAWPARCCLRSARRWLPLPDSLGESEVP